MQPAGEQLITLTVKEIHEAANGFKTIMFEENVDYQPGQYLTFIYNDQGKEIRRSYSMLSVPGEPLTIGVKRIENGVFSRYLTDRVKPGDKLVSAGAAGRFTIPAEINNYKQVFLFAAGSGITPVYSLVKHLLFTIEHIKVILVYSNHSHARAAFIEDLQLLEKQFTGRLINQFIFSTNKNLSLAHLNMDRVRQLVTTHGAGILDDSLYYICGPHAYMRMVGYGLEAAGISSNNIKKENFNTTRLPFKQRPPDTGNYTVYLTVNNQQYSFPVNYPDTILKAARKAGLSIPYSCDTGRCGSCALRCTQGTVWMSNNEVLIPHDIEAGLILTCVGHPVGGDIALQG
ncbi:MAG TPA: iron-sulfur cluster-binding domain-containing protein [Bacteroidia bacterium]|nr:iron-sulfur cluster-binding domain-containing protein [Bacteroidia bacterium]